MLFLAVTLGFFVENQREHYLEHQRERQFMRTMIKDLEQDLVNADLNIKRRIETIDWCNSMYRLMTTTAHLDPAEQQS